MRGLNVQDSDGEVDLGHAKSCCSCCSFCSCGISRDERQKKLFRTIKLLDLSQNDLRCRGAAIVACMSQRMPRLEEINLAKNLIHTEGLMYLFSMRRQDPEDGSKYSDLKVLNLARNNIRTESLADKTVLEGLLGKKTEDKRQLESKLETLILTDNQINPNSFDNFAKAIVTNKSLTKLDLRDNELGDEGAR